MNISLPDALTDLIRRNQDRQRLRALLLEGAASAPGEVADDGYFDELGDRVRRRQGK